MEKEVFITEEERAKCQKVADAFAELYDTNHQKERTKENKMPFNEGSVLLIVEDDNLLNKTLAYNLTSDGLSGYFENNSYIRSGGRGNCMFLRFLLCP